MHITEFESAWSEDPTAILEVEGILLLAIDPVGLVLSSFQSPIGERPKRGIQILGSRVKEELLSKIGGRTGGPAFCEEAIIRGVFIKSDGPCGYCSEKLIQITILDKYFGPREFHFP